MLRLCENVKMIVFTHGSMSQVGRLFAIGNLVSTDGFENSFFITSDIDLWPISMKNYTLPDNKEILITRQMSPVQECVNIGYFCQ